MEEEEVWVLGLLSPAPSTGGMCDPHRGLVTQPYPRAEAPSQHGVPASHRDAPSAFSPNSWTLGKVRNSRKIREDPSLRGDHMVSPGGPTLTLPSHSTTCPICQG